MRRNRPYTDGAAVRCDRKHSGARNRSGESDGTSAPQVRYTTCGANATMGISVGYADNYYSGLADQWIVLPPAPDGDYCLVIVGNVVAFETMTTQGGLPLPGLIERTPTYRSNAAGVTITITGNGTAVSPTYATGLPPTAGQSCTGP